MSEDNFWESEDTMSEEEADEVLNQTEEQPEYSSEEDVDAVFEEETETDSQVLKDASLRLEQGNLYKMLLKHDLFENVEADERAIKNVQKELRAFIRERLEILVGLKSDPKILPKQNRAEFPFSELEIQLLKEFLGKVTGKTEKPKQPTAIKPAVVSPAVSKIKPVLGNSNVKVSAPKKAQPKPQQAKPKPQQANPKEEEPRLQKSPFEMTAAELIDYNKKIVSTRQQNRKAISVKKMPMPDSKQLETMYANRAQTNSGTNLIGAILTKMGKGAPSLIETVDSGFEDSSNDERM